MADPCVDAIDRKVRKDFRHTAAQRSARTIAGDEIALRQDVEGVDDSLPLGGKTSLQDLPPRQLLFAVEIGGPAAEAMPQFAERPLAGFVVQHCADLIHKIIAG